MKYLGFLFVIVLIGCGSGGAGISPVAPDVPGDVDYTSLSIISFDFIDPDTGFYATACVFNNSDQTFINLAYYSDSLGDKAIMLSYFKRGFDVGPNETKCFDSRRQVYDGHGLTVHEQPLLSGEYVYDFKIYTYYRNYDGVLITKRQQSITVL